MSVLFSVRDTSGPSAAIELAQNRVSGATVEWRGRRAAIVAHALEPLPDGALTASLMAANIHDRPTVAIALGRVLDQLGRPRRIALVVPDPVAKVSLLKFEQVPARTEDLDQLVRWQVRKTAPFVIDDARVSYSTGQGGSDGQEFIVSLARQDIVREYEQLCADAGAHAGIVDLATFNVINAVLAAWTPPAADWLLVNVAPDYATIAILRGPHLIFFRNRSAEANGTLTDLVHQTAMYYEDRLSGAGFTRVMLAGAAGSDLRHAADVEQVRRSLEERLSTPVETVDARAAAALSDRISADPALLDTLAPLVGVLLRGQAV